MEEHFDIGLALRVFDKIISHGVKTEDRYVYQNVTAWNDVDGYTVQLSDEQVTLSIYFHNRYEFDYESSKQLGIFLNKLKSIDISTV